MSGLEIAGVVLGVIPILANQLDNYVHGIQTLKSLRTRRYKIEFKGYLTKLQTQKSLFVNTLEKVLEDVVEYEDDISELIRNPTGPMWGDVIIQKKVRQKLGRDYEPFAGNMSELARLLNICCQKLGLETNSMKASTSWADSSTLERELKKFKDVVAKSIYKDLLSRMADANASLQTITENACDRETKGKKKKLSRRLLTKFKNGRRHAKGLYNAMIRGTCWTCDWKHKHLIYIHLNADADETLPVGNHPEGVGHASCTEQSESHSFTLVIGSDTKDKNASPAGHWKQILAECLCPQPAPPALSTSETMKSTSSSFSTASSVTLNSPVQTQKKSVHWGLMTATVEGLVLPDCKPKDGQMTKTTKFPPAISDMCFALAATATARAIHKDPIGLLQDAADPASQYNIFLVDSTVPAGDDWQSLKELLAPNIQKRVQQPLIKLSRRERLRLAVNLACSVLQFHGSWLKEDWQTDDILFRSGQYQGYGQKDAYSPCLRLRLSESESGAKPRSLNGSALSPTSPYSSSLQKEPLFPLGVALIELSLGHTLSDLSSNSDHERGIMANLTATRHYIQSVNDESGMVYGEVVKKCLFWTDTSTTQLDDAEFQEAMFSSVVVPLVKGLRDFENRGF